MVLSFYSKSFSICEVEAATPNPHALRSTYHVWIRSTSFVMLQLEGGAAPYGRHHTARASFEFLQAPNIISTRSLSSCKCMTSSFALEQESIFYHFRLMYLKS